MRSDRREKKASAFETTRQGEVGSETRKTRRNARVQVHVLLGRERVFALLLLEDAAELHDALLLVRERGGRSDRAREGAASDPRRVTFARKTGASDAARREPRSREYRRVSRGRACMKSHPSSRLITLRSFIIVDARASRSRCVDQERVGTLARRAAVADEI
jgi:hypothetical protein